jgi:hypothetical protein
MRGVVMHNASVDYAVILRAALDQGLLLAQALEFLRASGASPAEAATAVEATLYLPHDEAREAVKRSRAWSGPRSGAQLHGTQREWYGSIGQHGRSGRGAASVLPHLPRPPRANSASR